MTMKLGIKKQAAPKEWIDKAVYSIPELHRSEIKEPNSFLILAVIQQLHLLGLAPLVKEKPTCRRIGHY